LIPATASPGIAALTSSSALPGALRRNKALDPMALACIMETKDLIYAFGIIVTLFLGAWNFIQGHRATRKASFINTVTAQRVLWIEQMRQDVSKFVGLTHTGACLS
jgi:hypothetical protein